MATKNKTQKLVPELRFPEFRGDGAWEALRLGELGKVCMCKRVMKHETSEVGEIPFYKIGTFGKKADASIRRKLFEDFKSKYSYPKKGDILISAAGTIGRTVVFDGQEAYFQDSNIVWIANSEKLVRNAFLYYCYSNVQWTTDNNTIPRLYNENLRNIQILAPSPPEQQKIADCLGSLDELLAAHRRKLAALQDHKKGLLQQLFPSVEGASSSPTRKQREQDAPTTIQTTPNLRFPGFEGEWEEKKLEIITVRGSGHTPNKTHPEYYNGGIKWISLADSNRLDNGIISETTIEISEQGIKKSSAKLHPAGCVVLSRDAGVGKSAVMGCDMAVSQHFIVWKCKNELISNWFLYYHLQKLKPFLEMIATGSTIKTIGLPFFKSMTLLLPSRNEQQIIADCLSALDALITAQTGQLAALQAHKKGLMQKLFPHPEGIA